MSHPVFDGTPTELPTPHPSIRKLSNILFVLIHDDGSEHTVTAAEIAECIRVDRLLRTDRFPSRWPLIWNDFTEHFNINNTLDGRRFHTPSDGHSGAIDHVGDPITWADFGIQKHHIGILGRADSIDLNPARRRWVDTQLWSAAMGNNEKRPRPAYSPICDSIPVPQPQLNGSVQQPFDGRPDKRPRREIPLSSREPPPPQLSKSKAKAKKDTTKEKARDIHTVEESTLSARNNTHGMDTEL